MWHHPRATSQISSWDRPHPEVPRDGGEPLTNKAEEVTSIQMIRDRKRTGTKELLDGSERQEWKSWLKTQHSTTKIMASGPITTWQIEGGKVKTWEILFLDSKIIVDIDCSHDTEKCLLFERKAMTNLDSILKSRDITLPTSQSYVFSSIHVWMWELDHKEGWSKVRWKSLSHDQLFATQWTIQSTEFSRPEYWSG